MASEIVELILKAKDLASESINRLRGGMDKLSTSGKTVSTSFDSVQKRTGSMLSSFKSLIITIGAAAAAYKTFQALVSVPLKGLEFSKQMESARLGIASIIAATQDLITQDGRRLEGVEKLNEAQKIARDLMEEIQIAGLKTVATTQELVEGFQALLGPASSAGLTMKETKDVTVAIVQAMGALGVEMNQLSAEGRSLLDGSIRPTQDRLATALGITGEMVKKWKEQGVLYDELTKKLEPFKLAGADLANTWSGLVSNIKEGIAFIGSRMTAGLFEDVKAAMQTILNVFIDIRNFDVGSGIKNLVEGIKGIGRDIGTVIKGGMEVFVDLLKRANDYIGSHKKELGAIWDTVKQIGGQLWEIVKQIASFAGGIARVGVEGGVILGTLKLINVALAGVNDIVGWIVLGFKTAAAIIYNIMVPAIERVAEVTASVLRVIPGLRDVGDSLVSMVSAMRTQQKLINEDLEKTAAKYRDGIAPHTMKALAVNKEIEETIKKQNAALDETPVKIEKVKTSYEEWRAGLQKGSEEYTKIQEKEIKVMEARVAYEKALLEKQYKERTISYEEYARRVQELDEQVYMKRLELIDMVLEVERKGDESHYQRVAELEVVRTEMVLQHATERLKHVEKTHMDEFKTWETLQELKLNTLKANLDLQDTLDEAAVKSGVMRQSQALANKLARYEEYQRTIIEKAEDAARKIAEAEGYGSDAYKKAITERERLQIELEQTIIESEYNIAEARKSEEIEAAKFIAEITKDRAELVVQQQEETYEKVQRFYDLQLISAQQYYEALSELDRTYTSKFKAELQERSEQLNIAIQIITERRQRLEEAVSGLMTDTWEEVKKYFGDWKTAVKTTINDVQYQIDQFMNDTTMKGYETFWNAQLFGRRLIEMVGTTVYEWAQRVTDYIMYVKSQLASLEDYIASLRMQLAQLRGDRLAELELWFEQEKEKLEEKYEEELGKTAEYYEALELLLEVYKEKKKKILEDMEKDEEEYEEEREKRAGGIVNDIISKALPDMRNIIPGAGAAAAMQTVEVKVSKELKLQLDLNIPHFDKESTRRWVRSDLWPELSEFLRLKGIDL